MSITQQDLILAFKKNNEHYLLKIHRYLNQRYHHLLFGNQIEDEFEVNEWMQFKQVESTWMQSEMAECLNRYDCRKPVNIASQVELKLLEHPVNQHSIYHYLEQDASLDDIKYFISIESILNLEFFDYLALSVVGVPDLARSEIMQNLWDESGRGCIKHYHTNQFKAVLKSLGIEYDRKKVVDKMTWEALAGINLFSYLSRHPAQKMKYFGLMAATELLDPPHYSRLLRGLRRYQGKQKIDLTYYLEHETLDIVHGSSWLSKVILPMLSKSPELLEDFWIGFYLRLDSVQRYYDCLLTQFVKTHAA